MHKPVQIVFHGLPVSEAAETVCRQELAKLERYGQIVGGQVAVSVPHRHHREGNLYHIRIELQLAGGVVVANRVPPEHHADEDLLVAIGEAFRRARRRVQDYVRRQRGDVKRHALPRGQGSTE